MSSKGQSPNPASLLFVSDGAYQFCMGMSPPAKAFSSELPPRALIAVWQVPQWPSPSTRYAPRFHSALRFRIGTKLAFVKVKGSPTDEKAAIVVGESQFILAIRLMDRLERAEVRKDRVRIRARDLAVRRERHGGIQQRAIARPPGVHHVVEIVGRPIADAGLRIRCDVGRIQRAKGRGERKATGEGWPVVL